MLPPPLPSLLALFRSLFSCASILHRTDGGVQYIYSYLYICNRQNTTVAVMSRVLFGSLEVDSYDVAPGDDGDKDQTMSVSKGLAGVFFCPCFKGAQV